MNSIYVRVSVSTVTLLLVILATANVVVGQGQRPSYQQRLVEKFDEDKNGRVEGPERVAALKWIVAEREKNPPRRRGSGQGDDSDIEPQQIGKSDVENFPNRDLYDVDVIRTIFLDFPQSNWADEMALLWRTEISTPATLTMDGKQYPDVGIRFRGSSSFFTVLNRKKKSFAISIDWANQRQRLSGYKSLNLLSGHADPTFMRSVLFSHIAGQYVPTPKTCWVQLVINGESWGLYINDQQINKDFTADAFGARKGTRWKIRPNFKGEAALAYQGPNIEDYTGKYSIGFSDSEPKAWKRLIELCDTLSNSPSEELQQKLPPLLDVDHALWFLALDNVLMDGDGYHYRGSDYALYLHPDGRFYPLFRDNNESFSYGGGPGGFGRRDPFERGKGSLKLDPLVHVDEQRAALCHALLSVPKWRSQYLENCRTIARDWLDWTKTGALVANWQQRIEPLIKADDKALYGYDAFLTGLDQGTERKPGLKKFCDERRAFLAEYKASNEDN